MPGIKSLKTTIQTVSTAAHLRSNSFEDKSRNIGIEQV